jgi:hypothetical protein
MGGRSDVVVKSGGVRRAGAKASEYRVQLEPARELSPLAYRLQMAGELEAVTARAVNARWRVERGESLFSIFADGSLAGWRLRLALSRIAGQPADEWDREAGRLQLERWALVLRLLAELGQDVPSMAAVRKAVAR